MDKKLSPTLTLAVRVSYRIVKIRGDGSWEWTPLCLSKHPKRTAASSKLTLLMTQALKRRMGPFREAHLRVGVRNSFFKIKCTCPGLEIQPVPIAPEDSKVMMKRHLFPAIYPPVRHWRTESSRPRFQAIYTQPDYFAKRKPNNTCSFEQVLRLGGSKFKN